MYVIRILILHFLILRFISKLPLDSMANVQDIFPRVQDMLTIKFSGIKSNSSFDMFV